MTLIDSKRSLVAPDNGPHIHSYANLCGVFHQPQLYKDGELVWSGAHYTSHLDAQAELRRLARLEEALRSLRSLVAVKSPEAA